MSCYQNIKCCYKPNCSICPTGPAGPLGEAGPTGLPGLTEATGPTGPKGSVGLRGFPGATGVSGATGPLGVPGTTGDTGQAGPAGPIGDTGATGATGATGPIGVTGSTGPGGEASNTGATGPIGIIGTTGPTGPAGQIGNTGPSAGSGAVVFAEGPNIPSASNIDNYNLSPNFSFFKITGTTASDITGFQNGVSGRLIILVNNTDKNQTFQNEDIGSTGSNRLTLGVANKTINPNQTISFIYMTGLTIGILTNQSRWVLFSTT